MIFIMKYVLFYFLDTFMNHSGKAGITLCKI